MRSMLKNYAAEEKDEDTGVPNGNYDMDKAGARRACAELVATHKGLTGDANKQYLETYFARTWAHFDVNGTGAIPVETMPQLARFILSDQYV